VIPSKSFEPDMKYWQIKHTGWFHPCFEPDMKYWQIEHTGWFNPKFFNQTWRIDNLNIQGCLFQNFWMDETTLMFNLSVLHVWFKTFGWNHHVYSNCLFFISSSKLLDGITLYFPLFYFISGSKNLDWITLYVQLVITSCLVQNFWMESPFMFN
jgi:hypothetical protein